MTPVLVFDIESVPDVAGARRLRPALAGLSDADVAERLFEERREKTGSDFLPLHLHRVVAISCAFRDDGIPRAIDRHATGGGIQLSAASTPANRLGAPLTRTRIQKVFKFPFSSQRNLSHAETVTRYLSVGHSGQPLDALQKTRKAAPGWNLKRPPSCSSPLAR